VALEAAAKRALEGFQAGICDDFNGEVAMAALFELVREFHQYSSGRARSEMDAVPLRAVLDALREALGVMGLFEKIGREEVPAEILSMAEERQKARQDRDFARADALRDEILAAGFSIEDSPDGPRLRRA
jgi:cysteinyl-tRNA synthetase